jgi:hypothetical protein
MSSLPSPQQRLLDAIAPLSDRQITLILQFIETLTHPPTSPETGLNPDPLADFVGATHHGHLASAIDDTLYSPN